MSSSEPAQSVVERVQNFVSENKKVVLIGAAVAAVAIGGAAYYASTSGSDEDKAARRKDKKKSKSSKKKKGVSDADGPLLEEVSPKEAQVAEQDDELSLTEEQIATMSEQERSKAALALKSKGNAMYGKRDFVKAAAYYTKAIEITPKVEPTYYSNRAACYLNMNPPQMEKVVADCDEALKHDRRYEKALNRRAGALEQLGRYEEALRDFTTLTILEQFKKEGTTTAVERVLKKLSEAKAKEILASRPEGRLPSHTFCSAYFGAFRPRPIPALPDAPTSGDERLVGALQALEAQDFIHALTLLNEALSQGISTDEGKAYALNLRGTFKFLTGNVDGAKEDLEASLEVMPSFTQTWVKLASIWMERGDVPKTFECFEEALKQNKNDPDIFYHRGQVLFIMNKFEEAANDYIKSTELDDNFVFSHIQLAVAQYKSGQLPKGMETFRQTLLKFPSRSEPHNYYGELLLDQGLFPDAVDKFDTAISLEKAKPPPMNVLPLVNKGLALFQWKGDISAAEQCVAEAVTIDPDSEAAVATLAQLKLQQNKIDEAVKLFEKQVDLARSEPELISALTYRYASAAQLQFVREYPELAVTLSNIAQEIARGGGAA